MTSICGPDHDLQESLLRSRGVTGLPCPPVGNPVAGPHGGSTPAHGQGIWAIQNQKCQVPYHGPCQAPLTKLSRRFGHEEGTIDNAIIARKTNYGTFIFIFQTEGSGALFARGSRARATGEGNGATREI